MNKYITTINQLIIMSYNADMYPSPKLNTFLNIANSDLEFEHNGQNIGKFVGYRFKNDDKVYTPTTDFGWNYMKNSYRFPSGVYDMCELIFTKSNLNFMNCNYSISQNKLVKNIS